MDTTFTGHHLPFRYADRRTLPTHNSLTPCQGAAQSRPLALTGAARVSVSDESARQGGRARPKRTLSPGQEGLAATVGLKRMPPRTPDALDTGYGM